MIQQIIRFTISGIVLTFSVSCFAQGGSEAAIASNGASKTPETVTTKAVDIPTRSGVTERVLVLTPPNPKAAVILFAGGNGGLMITPAGAITSLAGNFLVRSRQMFADQGLMTVVIAAPSDHQSPPFLAGGFRTSSQHVADIKAVIAWIRSQAKVPVWLVGTSHGTQSAANAAAQLTGPEGPDGLVLTSTVLNDNKETPVPALPLNRIRVPVLVVHHVQDGCSKCPYSDIPALMAKFTGAAKKQVIPIQGGQTKGDPCEAWSHHGFNGNEQEVVNQIANWISAN
jgi:dienelactone hydrolase